VQGDIRVGVILYGATPTLTLPLTSFNSLISAEEVIRQLPFDGRSVDAAAAVRLLRTSGFVGRRPGASAVAVLLTNGDVYNSAQANLLQEVNLGKDAGITFLTLSVGLWRLTYVLYSITTPVVSNTFLVDDINNIQLAAKPLADAICKNEDFCLTQPCQNGGTCTNQINTRECNCTDQWTGTNCSQVKCTGSADIVFDLDASGSIEDTNFQLMTRFVMTVVQNLNVVSQPGDTGAEIGLMTFNETVWIHFNLNTYTNKDQLVNAIFVPYTGGKTNTANSIRVADSQMFTASNGDRQSVPNVLVVITDGLSNDPNATWQQAMATRANNISIIAVGIGNQVDDNELRAIASDPLDFNVLHATNYSTLSAELNNKLQAALCPNDTLCQSSPCQNGGTCRAIFGGIACDCQPASTGTRCERKCSGVLDIIVVLDSSGSIQSQRFQLIKLMIMEMVQNLEIGSDKTRVGLLYFSRKADLMFNLDTYFVKQDLIEAIRRVEYVGNVTYTADALRMLRTLFQPQYGDRPNVQNLAIVVTDGNSNVDPNSTVSEAKLTRLSGVRIVTATLGDYVNLDEVRAIASQPWSANLFYVDNYTLWTQISPQLVNATCDDVNECLSNPCLNGGTCLDRFAYYFCSCTAGFAGTNCERRCGAMIDVGFVLDISGSIEDESNVPLVINFTRTMVANLDITNDISRVGVVTFATDVRDRIYFNEYVKNPEGLIESLMFYLEPGGFTNTQAALRTMREEIFGPNGQGPGNRPNVAEMVVVVSDGNSNVLPNNTIPEATLLKTTGAKIYSVVINENHNLNEMGQISSNSSLYLYRLPDYNSVQSVVNQILDDMCST